MYLLYLTMKTPNGIMALCIMLYAIVVAVLCPILRKREPEPSCSSVTS